MPSASSFYDNRRCNITSGFAEWSAQLCENLIAEVDVVSMAASLRVASLKPRKQVHRALLSNRTRALTQISAAIILASMPRRNPRHQPKSSGQHAKAGLEAPVQDVGRTPMHGIVLSTCAPGHTMCLEVFAQLQEATNRSQRRAAIPSLLAACFTVPFVLPASSKPTHAA